MLAAMMNELLHTHRRWVWKILAVKKVYHCWEWKNAEWRSYERQSIALDSMNQLQVISISPNCKKKNKVSLRCDERTSTCSCEWISESLGNESTRWSVDSRLWWLWWSGIWLMLKRVVDFNSRDFSWEMRENSRQLHNTQFEWVLAASAEQTRK